MGRQIQRVPLDFDWPLEKTWEGFLLPKELRERECETCGGRGTTTARRWAEATVMALLMLTDDLREQRRGRPMHPYFNKYPIIGWGTRPSEDIAELTAGLAGRSGVDRAFGHDTLDRWAATDRVVTAAGLDPKVWGKCADCAGAGSTEAYPGQRAEAEAWEPMDPPTGEGWQLWQTVSEGSPISPVFPTARDLAVWLTTPGANWGKPFGDVESALRFVEAGWAPSLMSSPTTGVVDGAHWMGEAR